jgi:hypothetical protein
MLELFARFTDVQVYILESFLLKIIQWKWILFVWVRRLFRVCRYAKHDGAADHYSNTFCSGKTYIWCYFHCCAHVDMFSRFDPLNLEVLENATRERAFWPRSGTERLPPKLNLILTHCQLTKRRRGQSLPLENRDRLSHLHSEVSLPQQNFMCRGHRPQLVYRFTVLREESE